MDKFLVFCFWVESVRICLKVRRCLLDFVARIDNQVEISQAHGSSLLGLGAWLFIARRRYFLTVLRAKPVRVEISRMDM